MLYFKSFSSQISLAYFIDFILKITDLVFILLDVHLRLIVFSSQLINCIMSLAKLLLISRSSSWKLWSRAASAIPLKSVNVTLKALNSQILSIKLL